MGTRHFIGVIIDGDYKIAQYGQWDGNPSGQGVNILKFLAGVDWYRFEDNLRACRFMTADEVYEFNRTAPRDWPKQYPHLSRDTSAGILELVEAHPLTLVDSRDFVCDSLFCEWAYVIDLDLGQFEVYVGLNEAPLPPGQRFSGLKPKPDSSGQVEFYPVKLQVIYSLGDLPDAAQFCTDCTTDNEEA